MQILQNKILEKEVLLLKINRKKDEELYCTLLTEPECMYELLDSIKDFLPDASSFDICLNREKNNIFLAIMDNKISEVERQIILQKSMEITHSPHIKWKNFSNSIEDPINLIDERWYKIPSIAKLLDSPIKEGILYKYKDKDELYLLTKDYKAIEFFEEAANQIDYCMENIGDVSKIKRSLLNS